VNVRTEKQDRPNKNVYRQEFKNMKNRRHFTVRMLNMSMWNSNADPTQGRPTVCTDRCLSADLAVCLSLCLAGPFGQLHLPYVGVVIDNTCFIYMFYDILLDHRRNN
jgi:hypothetical protein